MNRPRQTISTKPIIKAKKNSRIVLIPLITGPIAIKLQYRIMTQQTSEQSNYGQSLVNNRLSHMPVNQQDNLGQFSKFVLLNII